LYDNHFNQWTIDSKGSKIKEIDKVVDIFNNHITGVVNTLISNLTNAMAERLNRKIKELKTVAR